MLIAGTETGLLREVDIEGRRSKVIGSEDQDRGRGVVALAWGRNKEFYCARKNGDLEIWENFGDGWAERKERTLVGECVGLGVSEGVVACSDDGRVQYKTTFDVEGAVSAFDVRNQRVAVGGREHELSVWNLETTDREWRARNVPHDFLDLRRPVWVAAARFTSETTLLAGTKYKELRGYDVRAQRRPVTELAATDHAIRQLLVLDDSTVLVADVAGAVLSYDRRKNKIRSRYPGPAGSVRALAAHPAAPGLLFAAAGLDRFVHVWDASRIRDRKPVSSIYCKQRLNALLWGAGRAASTSP